MAWIADVCPLVEILAGFIEDLDAIVVAVRDVDPTLRVECHVMNQIELAMSRALRAPLPQVLSVLVELYDARVVITIGHIERTVGHEEQRQAG